jgi:hypothetical protein
MPAVDETAARAARAATLVIFSGRVVASAGERRRTRRPKGIAGRSGSRSERGGWPRPGRY